MSNILKEELEETLRLLDSYQELAVDQIDDDSFIARGNGSDSSTHRTCSRPQKTN